MKKIFLLLIFLSSVLNAQPKFWTWTGGNDRDWDAYFAELEDVGITGVLMGATKERYQQVIPIAQKYGIEIHAWLWIMNNRDIAAEHPEWLDYNRLGESMSEEKAYVDYYKFLNPIIPEVKEEILEYMEGVISIEGLSGISLDYCRYVDAVLPTSLWDHYGIVQDKIYPKWDYGYHPMMIEAFEKEYGYNPQNNFSEQEHKTGVPYDEKWHQFRMDKVNDIAKAIGELAHSYDKVISASPFPTPGMSRRMVYQDWGEWELDMAFPMIYNGFYYGDLEWISNCVKECVRDSKCPDNIYIGLYMPDYQGTPDFSLSEAIKVAIKSGAKGFSVFQYDHLPEQQRQELKTLIQSL